MSRTHERPGHKVASSFYGTYRRSRSCDGAGCFCFGRRFGGRSRRPAREFAIPEVRRTPFQVEPRK